MNNNSNSIWMIKLDWSKILFKLGLTSINQIPEMKINEVISILRKIYSINDLLRFEPEELDILMINKLSILMKKELTILKKKQKDVHNFPLFADNINKKKIKDFIKVELKRTLKKPKNKFGKTDGKNKKSSPNCNSKQITSTAKFDCKETKELLKDLRSGNIFKFFKKLLKRAKEGTNIDE